MSDGNNSISVLEAVEPRRLCAGGFVATYFPTTSFTGTAVTRNDAAIAFNWKKTGPAASIPVAAFSARWDGTLNPTATGRHNVYVTTEGGLRVWVGHKLVLNKPAAPGTPTNYKIPVVLTAGQPVDLQIEYRHDGGRGSIGVTWAAPGGEKRVLTGDGTTARTPTLDDKIDHARIFAVDQLVTTYQTSSVKKGFPIRSDSGKNPAWLTADSTDWTVGTFAGSMWELNKTFAGWDVPATAWTTPLANVHIVGDEFGREWAAYKPYYDATGDAAARKVLLDSAALKMTAWSKTVRAFRTPELVSHSGNKNADFGVLMDQTMDMAQLLWAGVQTGDAAYKDRVVAHMYTVAKNMVRADGSVFQRGYFNGTTGRFVVGENYQGYSDASTWSRAQAWAMHSFATVAAATGDSGLLAVAQKVADYYAKNVPVDGVPYWDFRSPNIPKTYRDTSAAAIAADALVVLAPQTSGTARVAYEAEATTILNSLSTTYLAAGSTVKGVLQHGAYNVPKNKSPDASLMFGDYYFLRAINDYAAATF